MTTSAAVRRDELLYESNAALRLVDRALQEMGLQDAESYGEGEQVGDGEAFGDAAGDAPAAGQELESVD